MVDLADTDLDNLKVLQFLINVTNYVHRNQVYLVFSKDFAKIIIYKHTTEIFQICKV